MGLNMHLYGIKIDDDEKSKGVWEECMHWEKAYQVHDFFHKRFINEKDLCGFYKISSDDLEQLKLLSYIVLMNKDSVESKNVAMGLLPPNMIGCRLRRGDIDDLYFEQIEETYNGLVQILSGQEYEAFFYTVDL